MNSTEIHSVQPSLCMIHTKWLPQKEKPDHDDSEHPQIWIFLKFLKVGSKNMIRGGQVGVKLNPSSAGSGTVLTR